MIYLSEKHQQLSEGQQSGLMMWFDRLQFDRKVTAISLSLVVGVGAAAMGWWGEASDRVDFCVKTPPGGENCVDTNNRPYRMTRYHWQQWQKEGRPKQVRFNGVVKASNPHKPFFAIAAFMGFALAGWMLRHLQHRESQLTALEAIATNRDMAMAEIHATQELELITHDHTVTIQQAELIAQSEIHLTQMDAEDAIFEANTAGMTPEQKQQYIDFLRQQKTPYLQGSQTLQGIVDPSDKVAGAEDREVLALGVTSWVNNLIRQTALIWGNQGGGKSWLARYVVKLKKDAGYKVIVLDPDSNRAEWVGVESYHSWDEIENQIRAYVDELEARLQVFNESTLSEEEWRSHLWTTGKATSLIIEEATTYSSFIKDVELLEKFGKLALTKSRKQELPVLVVSHNNTQSCLFGIKGLYNLVSKMLQVECLAEVDRVTLQPNSTGKARVKLDSSNEWVEVELPKLTAKIKNFEGSTATTANVTPTLTPEQLETIYQLEFNLATPSPVPPVSLSPVATTILEIIQHAAKYPISLESIRKSRRWGEKTPDMGTLDAGLYELVREGKVTGDRSQGFCL